MSDPNYRHKFYPNRKGLCKEVIRGRHCGKHREDPVHERYEKFIDEEAERQVNTTMNHIRGGEDMTEIPRPIQGLYGKTREYTHGFEVGQQSLINDGWRPVPNEGEIEKHIDKTRPPHIVYDLSFRSTRKQVAQELHDWLMNYGGERDEM